MVEVKKIHSSSQGTRVRERMAKFSSFSQLWSWVLASKRRRNRVGFILALVIVLSLIRGCSSSDSPDNHYHIGQDMRWSSLSLMGKERNLSAFNSDLLATIAKLENIRLKLTSTVDKELINKLENGEFQGVITTLKPTTINQNAFIFSEPYFLLGPLLITSSSAPSKGWNEMARKIVGVQSNSPALLDLEKDPSIQIKLYDNILRALADLDENRIDGVVFPALPAYIYTKTFYEGRLKIATSPLTDEGLRLVTLKNEKGRQLIAHFNAGLKKMREEGTYDRLLKQWGLMNLEKIEN